MSELIYKKKDGFYFCVNDFSRKENIPYQVLLLDKKATYKKGIDYALANGINQIEINLEYNVAHAFKSIVGTLYWMIF